MSLTIDSSPRRAFITGLRDLADYLARHPAVAVPEYGTEILLHAASTDDGGCAQVDRFARQLGVPVENEPGLLRPLPGRPVLRPGRLPDGRHFRGGHGPPPRARLLPRLRHPRHLDLTLKRQARERHSIMPITILDYVKSVVGDKDTYTAEDCLASGVDILGGCQGCHATHRAATTPTPPPPGTGAAPTASARTDSPPSPTSPPTTSRS